MDCEQKQDIQKEYQKFKKLIARKVLISYFFLTTHNNLYK